MADGSPRHPISEEQAAFRSADNPLSIINAMYGPEARYLDGFENGVGYLTISHQLISQGTTPEDIDRVDEVGRGYLNVTQEHAAGHFPGDLPSVFPGHRNLRAAGSHLLQYQFPHYRETNEPGGIAGFERVAFKRPVTPGQTLEYNLFLPKNDIFHHGQDITVTRANETVMEVAGLRTEIRVNSNSLREDQLIEAAAQVLGVAGLKDQTDLIADDGHPRMLPLFEEVGETTFGDTSDLEAGATIRIVPGNVELTKRTLEGTVTIFQEGKDQPVLPETRLKAKVLPFAMFTRFVQ